MVDIGNFTYYSFEEVVRFMSGTTNGFHATIVMNNMEMEYEFTQDYR